MLTEILVNDMIGPEDISMTTILTTVIYQGRYLTYTVHLEMLKTFFIAIKQFLGTAMPILKLQHMFVCIMVG